ncbi:MAG TPA: hypothetical protein VJM33_02135 [Microthrixaceae bacterium]|nr:hypothetical protein [Microthrixaceae bacterium]
MATGRFITDTDPEVRRRLFARWRAMSVQERVDLTNRLCCDVEELAIAGIRLDHPDISSRDLRRELTRRRYGRGLADAAYGR